jgi:hypothetical protein
VDWGLLLEAQCFNANLPCLTVAEEKTNYTAYSSAAVCQRYNCCIFAASMLMTGAVPDAVAIAAAAAAAAGTLLLLLLGYCTSSHLDGEDHAHKACSEQGHPQGLRAH